jgi:hypothetical protein
MIGKLINQKFMKGGIVANECFRRSGW